MNSRKAIDKNHFENILELKYSICSKKTKFAIKWTWNNCKALGSICGNIASNF